LYENYIITITNKTIFIDSIIELDVTDFKRILKTDFTDLNLPCTELKGYCLFVLVSGYVC